MSRYIALFLVFGAVLLSGCSTQSSSYTTTTATSAGSTTTTAGGPTASVSIASFAFNPATLTVAAGTTVTWTNNDSTTHTVTSTAGPASFDSGFVSPGGTFSFKFTQVGTYEYHCSIHTYMLGSVTVH